MLFNWIWIVNREWKECFCVNNKIQTEFKLFQLPLDKQKNSKGKHSRNEMKMYSNLVRSSSAVRLTYPIIDECMGESRHAIFFRFGIAHTQSILELWVVRLYHLSTFLESRGGDIFYLIHPIVHRVAVCVSLSFFIILSFSFFFWIPLVFALYFFDTYYVCTIINFLVIFSSSFLVFR